MNEDQLLAGVDRLLREAGAEEVETSAGEPESEDAFDDARWQALALGTATAEEVRALEAEAASSPEAAALFEAYRPIDRQTRQRFVHRARQQLDAKPVDPPAPAGDEADSAGAATDHAFGQDRTPGDDRPATASAAKPDDESAAPRQVLPWPGARRASVRRWLAPAAAALAATLLWTLWPAAPNALPDYALTVEAGRSEMRGAEPPSQTLTLSPGDPFEILLRPASAVEQNLAVSVWVERRQGLEPSLEPVGLEPVELGTEISDTGSIRLTGLADGSLTAGSPQVDLTIVVAARGEMPEPAELERFGGEPAATVPWQRLRCRLLVSSEGT